MTSKKDIDQLIKRINATPGYVVPEDRTSSCHRRAFRSDKNGNPIGLGVTLPGTPGDHNQLNTTRRKLRRKLGWHDPLAKTNQMRKKPKFRVGEHMPQMSDVARVVRFEDGSEDAPAVDAPAASTSAASTSSRPPAGNPPPRPPINTGTVREAARYMWWHLHTKAAQDPDSAARRAGVTGHHWVGRLSDELREVYPELGGLDKQQFTYLNNRMRTILGEGGRLVSVKPGNPVVPSMFFIRDYPDQGAPHVAAPAITPAPAVAPTAPPDDSAPSGTLTPRKNTEPASGQKEVESTARDLTRADSHESTRNGEPSARRVSVEDLLGFLGEHEALLAERGEILAFAVEVAEHSEKLNRAANALVDRLRGRSNDGTA